MRTVCIKTNNLKSIEYLLEKLNNFELENIYYSHKKFKIYDNIIIHFKGKNERLFLQKISNVLASLVIEVYEEEIISKLLLGEYFYFNQFERDKILDNTIVDLYNDEEALYPSKKTYKLLCSDFYEYLKENKSIVLKGFITFRIKNYIEVLMDQIDKSVNKFIIEREYTEFISLLKMYTENEPSKCNTVNLIYNNSKTILLDEHKNVILADTNIFNAKYLSDISFSSNDYALNNLLTLNPKNIIIHLVDRAADEFINTIKLVFENRVHFCSDCSICKLYKNKEAIVKS